MFVSKSVSAFELLCIAKHTLCLLFMLHMLWLIYLYTERYPRFAIRVCYTGFQYWVDVAMSSTVSSHRTAESDVDGGSV